MKRRMVLLTVGLWVGLWAGQRLIRFVLDFIGVSVVGNAWVPILWAGGLAVLAAWLVGLWRGLTGRRLAVTAVVSLIALGAWQMSGSIVPASLSPANTGFLGEVADALLYLLYALEAVVVSWLVAGALIGFDVHRTRAAS